MFFSNVGVADVFRAYYKILKLSTGFSGTSTSQFRRRLQRIYSNVVFGISFVYLGFHALNTAIRATRYTPEFAQCLFEDLGLNGIQIVAILLRSTEQKFLYLMNSWRRRSTKWIEKRWSVFKTKWRLFSWRIFCVVSPWCQLFYSKHMYLYQRKNTKSEDLFMTTPDTRREHCHQWWRFRELMKLCPGIMKSFSVYSYI